jgi:hypothetical protein
MRALDTSNLGFSLGVQQWDKPNFTPPYLLIQSAKSISLHTQTTKECQGKRSLNGIMAIISKIWSQSALELDLSLCCLVLDAVPRRQSAHWRSPAHNPSTCQSHPSAVLARAFETTLGRASPHSALNLAGQTPPPLAPASSAPPARATQVSATVASHFQRPSASTEPLDSFPKTLWSFSKLEPRHCLTGEAESPLPDFGHPPPLVNQAIWWVIVQFLVPMSSLTSGEALWPVQLNYTALDSPESSPSTSSPHAHVDRPTPTIAGDDPHIGVTVKTSPTPSTTSPEQSRRR